MMVKICTGTKNFKGCGKTKPDNEFSADYKTLCKDCRNELKRNRYKTSSIDEIDQLSNNLITMPWR